MKIQIQKGRVNFEDAYQLRHEVFELEQGFVDEFDAIDEVAYHITLYKDDECVGVGRLYQDDDLSYHVGRFAIKETYRKAGYGRQLMKAIEDLAKSLGAKKLALSSQVQALKFYESCGYQAVGPGHFEQDCPHQNMIKLLD